MKILYIRNMNAEDAIAFLDKNIDSAYFNGEDILRVVHGKGDILKAITKSAAERYPYSEILADFYGDMNPGVTYIKFKR